MRLGSRCNEFDLLWLEGPWHEKPGHSRGMNRVGETDDQAAIRWPDSSWFAASCVSPGISDGQRRALARTQSMSHHADYPKWPMQAPFGFVLLWDAKHRALLVARMSSHHADYSVFRCSVPIQVFCAISQATPRSMARIHQVAVKRLDRVWRMPRKPLQK